MRVSSRAKALLGIVAIPLIVAKLAADRNRRNQSATEVPNIVQLFVANGWDLSRDPTHGRIDLDIQKYVEEIKPSTPAQRLAIENTLQIRRDSGRVIAGLTPSEAKALNAKKASVECCWAGKVAYPGRCPWHALEGHS